MYGKKIVENSCGDGNILVEIVDRYIIDCKNHNMKNDKIKQGLEQDILGIEIDLIHINNCKVRLNNLARKYNLIDVRWNILNEDFLKINLEDTFDFVVGNPPYITYKDLDLGTRNFIRNNFKTCNKGKFDYYYAFIEASIKSLKYCGKLGYLIPGNIFKNRFGESLREYILPSMTNIYDYTTQKLFSKKLTTSAIIICELGNEKNILKYTDMTKNKTIDILKKDLFGKWIFQEKKDSLSNEKMVCFGDYFHAANSIATLFNKAYIIYDYEEYDNYIKVKDYKIEKNILKKIETSRHKSVLKQAYILFPYYYENNNIKRYSEEEFEKIFPYATKYLKQFKMDLDKRKSEKKISWFEYGRSQALAHMNQKKLLTSILITDNVKVKELDEDTIPVSGLYITSKDIKKYSLETAKKILTSSMFLEYVKSIGIISNSNSFRISSRDINNFIFPSYMIDTN